MSIYNLRIYPYSIQKRGDSVFYMADADGGAVLVASGPDKALFDGTDVVRSGGLDMALLDGLGKLHSVEAYKLCPLTVENSKAVRKLFDFTNPVSHKGHDITIGLGDRLGLASAGHLHLLRDKNVFPVLAQQSIRELTLTGRTFDEVLASAVWAVFREGYTKGYGADGDHLKTRNEVKYALDCGYTMITLDCSEHIRNDFAVAPQAEIDARYLELPEGIGTELETRYLNKTFHISGVIDGTVDGTIDGIVDGIVDGNIAVNIGDVIGGDIAIEFNEADFRRMVLVYLPAINHASGVFSELVKDANIDFEVSIDETLTTTSPQSHFFVANELIRQGVEIASLAPRFVGEFQKGIDYRGDTAEFERDFLVHAKIAEKFGYKLSVHSGSDKFSIFPAVGRLTGGRYHLKTAGTNWLEAVRVIAAHEPSLYRRLHSFALENLIEAKKYYHTTENTANIADIDSVSDEELPLYLEQDDARQVLHITYGLILQAKASDGIPLFRDTIYQVLRTYEADYFQALENHIGRHLTALGV